MTHRTTRNAFAKHFLDSQLRIGRILECRQGRALKLAYNKHCLTVDLHCKHISYLTFNQLVLFTYCEETLIIVAELSKEDNIPCQLINDHHYYMQINKGDSCFTMHRDGEIFLGNKHAALQLKQDGGYRLNASSIQQQAVFDHRLVGYPIHLN